MSTVPGTASGHQAACTKAAARDPRSHGTGGPRSHRGPGDSRLHSQPWRPAGQRPWLVYCQVEAETGLGQPVPAVPLAEAAPMGRGAGVGWGAPRPVHTEVLLALTLLQLEHKWG